VPAAPAAILAGTACFGTESSEATRALRPFPSRVHGIHHRQPWLDSFRRKLNSSSERAPTTKTLTFLAVGAFQAAGSC
jgi:hypothetical protein